MARTRVEPPVAPALPASMVASAVRLQGAPKPVTKRLETKGWQSQAWYYYDTIGEFAFAANWVGNLLSRATVYATRDVGNGPQRVEPNSPADAVLDELFNDQDGRGQMLHDIGVAYTVAGECFIAGWEENDEQFWAVTSPQDLESIGGRWVLNKKPLPPGAFVMRMWRPHPRKRMQATSPARAALPILAEIEAITQRIQAEVTSRLTGAGVLWVPNQIAVAATTHTTDSNVTAGVSAASFSRTLMDTMATAIADRSDASAMVPIVVTADGEFIDKVTLTKFWSEMDSELLSLRTAATKRLGLALDMPPEVLTGAGEANHWSAWQIDESAIKAHAEPLLRAITVDLARGYLRPVLRDMGDIASDEVREYGIGSDTSEMRLRPNRSKEALELNDRGELSAVALRRETGFTEEDAMGPKEKAQWILQKMASGSATPEMVAQAARMLGANLPEPTVETTPNEARPTPSLEDHPTRDIPEQVNAALLMASEIMVFRALERGGNRLRTLTANKFTDVSASEVYLFIPCNKGTVDDCLVDAWSNVDRFAPDLGVMPQSWAACMDAYVRVLLAERKPHDRALLARHLSRVTPAPLRLVSA